MKQALKKTGSNFYNKPRDSNKREMSWNSRSYSLAKVSKLFRNYSSRDWWMRMVTLSMKPSEMMLVLTSSISDLKH